MSKQCFVVSPIGEEGTSVRKQADTVFDVIIEPACVATGYTCIRSDKIVGSDYVNQTILNLLKTADLVISDLSGQNPNVYFEYGYRTALDLPRIQIITKGESLPFDTSPIRTIFYELIDHKSLKSAKETLIETIIAEQDSLKDKVKKDNSDNGEFDYFSHDLKLSLKDEEISFAMAIIEDHISKEDFMARLEAFITNIPRESYEQLYNKYKKIENFFSLRCATWDDLSEALDDYGYGEVWDQIERPNSYTAAQILFVNSLIEDGCLN